MTRDQWHREEPREVRPFFQAERAEASLTSSAIRLFKLSERSTETGFDLDEIDFQKLNISVFPTISDPQRWLPQDLKPDDLEVILVLTQTFLKRSEVLRRFTLGVESSPEKWEISRDELSEFAGGRNVEVSIILCLRSDRAPKPGEPFIAGHWLAKKTFALKSRATPTLFDLRTRTDDEWVAAGLPPKTLYYVEYAGGIAEELEDGGSVATVYIHIDAHNRLVSSSSLGDAFQPMLASEIVLSVLTESLSDWGDLDVIHAQSPLATLLRQLGKETSALKLQDLKALVAKPGRARALLQDRLSVVQALR